MLSHWHHPKRITIHDISSLLFLASASDVKRFAAAFGSLIGFTKSTASWFFMTCRSDSVSCVLNEENSVSCTVSFAIQASNKNQRSKHMWFSGSAHASKLQWQKELQLSYASAPTANLVQKFQPSNSIQIEYYLRTNWCIVLLDCQCQFCVDLEMIWKWIGLRCDPAWLV